MKHILRIFSFLLFSFGFGAAWAQTQIESPVADNETEQTNVICSSAIIGNSIASRVNGAWGACSTWYYGSGASPALDACTPSTVWPSFDMTSRGAIIKHTVTVNAAYSSTHIYGDIKNIYVDPGGNMTFSAAYASSQTGKLDVCGTLTVTAGQIDLDNFDLTVKDGGVVNINGGVLEVAKITVESNGVININGGTLRRSCGSSAAVGLEVKAGGTINILSGAAGSKLVTYSCSPYYYTKLDGTIDCKNSLTSGNYTNFGLGGVIVSSGVSTGLIRTQNAYIPSFGTGVDVHVAANNFFGFNSKYGGTVEFYGSSNITMDAIYSPNNFYSLKVNISGSGNGLTLNDGGCTEVVGSLILAQGDLKFNDKKLLLRGTIEYTGSTKLVGSANAELVLAGKLSSTTSPCVNYFSGVTTDYPSSGNSQIRVEARNVEIKNPELRFGASGTLGRYHMVREDVALLKSPLTIKNELSLFTGKIQTTATNIITVDNTSPTAVKHHTTNWKQSVGYVSGPLKRKVAANNTYDFPVGYQNETIFHTSLTVLDPHHRRLTLKINAMSGIGFITVHYNRTIPNCLGSLTSPLLENSYNYEKLHTEGSWTVVPDVGVYTIDYTARAYTWGYETTKYGTPTLPANLYGILKRSDASVSCTDWDWINTSARPAKDALGRVIKSNASTTPATDTSYAERSGLTAFSEFGIGLQNPTPFPVELLTFTGKRLPNAQVKLDWATATELNSAFFQIERGENATEFTPVGVQIPAAGNSSNVKTYTQTDEKPLYDRAYYRLKQVDNDGTVHYSNTIEVAPSDTDPRGIQLVENPATGSLQIAMLHRARQAVLCKLYDVQGKQILTREFQPLSMSGVLEMPVNQLRPGVYLLEVTEGAQKWTEKVVVY